MTGHRDATVREGRRFLAARDKLAYREIGGRLYLRGFKSEPKGEETPANFRYLLQETVAYRRHFPRSTPGRFASSGLTALPIAVVVSPPSLAWTTCSVSIAEECSTQPTQVSLQASRTEARPRLRSPTSEVDARTRDSSQRTQDPLRA
jgi:hypothetical protein